jgi:hypothetical protein
MIGYFVYRSVKEGFDLVSPDYYNKEIKYQQQIDKMQNTLSLKDKPVPVYNKENQKIEIKFPIDSGNSKISGDIVFFKPDNAALDFKVEINPGENNVQEINAATIRKGFWKVKTSWYVNTTSYYQEDNLFID